MRGGRPQTGNCPVCGKEYSERNYKTFHHILPKRFFKGTGGLKEMCREDHNELEKEIPQDEILPEFRYREILDGFIEERRQEVFKIAV